MRLTVGPLPAAVYWRRRAVVLVGFAIVVLIIMYSCGATLSSNAGPQPSATTGAAGTPSSTTSLLRPTSPSPKPTPTATAFTLSTTTANANNGPCADAEVSVTATAARATMKPNSSLDFTITITNTSARTCSRDVGADVQELRLLLGGAIVWSSDDCSPNTGHDVRSFGPRGEVSFTRLWLGVRSRSGTGDRDCTGSQYAGVGTYQLVARLGQKLSSPFELQITTAA